MRLQRQQRLVLDSILLGFVGAASARLFSYLLAVAKHVFLLAIAGYGPPGLPSEGGSLHQVVGPHWLWLIPLSTTLGGLISGVLVYTFAPEAEGHGTDAAVAAFHRVSSRLRARVPPLKMITSAVTIGSGGAAGREGPTALVSAGIGSLYADLTHRSEADRRILLLAGMAAGLSAIFRSPVGTAVFAVEVLYGNVEFEAAALPYTMLASVVAYAVNGIFVGWSPLFQVPATVSPRAIEYLGYAVLGAAAGGVATLLPFVFYRVRDLFAALPIPPHFKPALGALALGVIALATPQVLAGGYGWIQAAIDGRLPPLLLLALTFVEILAFALTVASGGSGGVFAPSLFVGAMMGGFLAAVFGEPSANFAVVGMAAVFAGAAHVPVATMLMVTEMTGDYSLLAPAALAVVISELVQRYASAGLKYSSLYEAQVPARADSPVHDREQFQAAMKLLADGRRKLPATAGLLDVTGLLASGIPLDFGHGARMLAGQVTPESRCAGQLARTWFPGDNGARLVAVLRSNRTLLSPDGLTLTPGDCVIVLASAEAQERVRRVFTAASSPSTRGHDSERRTEPGASAPGPASQP